MISKNTIDELLGEFLDTKNIGRTAKQKIIKGLHLNVNKEEKIKEKKGKEIKKEAKISHGTSCPRIMTPANELAIEF